MEPLTIARKKGSTLIPEVNFEINGKCVISGESYMENPHDFYTTLYDWLETFTMEIKGAIELDIKLTYFNTGSAKGIKRVLNFLRDYKQAGHEVIVNWYFNQWDDDMSQEIDDFGLACDLNINKILLEA